MNRDRSAPFVITIDGPAGSGKSTTAREVARRLGWHHLDSGALYRALTLAVRRMGIPEAEWHTLTDDIFLRPDISIAPAGTRLEVLLDGCDPGPGLRDAETTRLSSILAKNARARARLTEVQRSALDFGSVVADGRDMGSVIFPDADLKVFLTASLEERARRRLLQDGRGVDGRSVRREAERIRHRDRTDATREVAPLRSPPGALEIDTTEVSFHAQVRRIVGAATEAAGTLTGRAPEK